MLTVQGLRWGKSWGKGTARASGTALIETNGIDRGHAVVTLTALRNHFPDGCGHTAEDRIYTKVRFRLSDFRAPSQNRTVTLTLPRTGCESF